MRIGIPTEVKPQEYRVALTPAGVRELTSRGHEVFVQAGAGLGSAHPDTEFASAGAVIVSSAAEVWGGSDLVLKVKEPIPSEFPLMRPGLMLFTYLHLAASRACTDALLDNEVTALAYETVQLPNGTLPLLAPMSEVAGRLAPQVGAHALLRASGGRGVLLGGVPGVPAGRVVIIGAGVAGMSAAAIAVGMHASVTILDRSVPALREADHRYRGAVDTVMSNATEIERAVRDADLVIGAVLIPGARAPRLVSNELVASMRPGSVLVDIAIDQGGCFEDSRPTTHDDPTYRVHESIFYCVANMPGAVPRTSTYALTNATLPYVVSLADHGLRTAIALDPALALGVNTVAGHLVNEAVAEAFGLASRPLAELVG